MSSVAAESSVTCFNPTCPVCQKRLKSERSYLKSILFNKNKESLKSFIDKRQSQFDKDIEDVITILVTPEVKGKPQVVISLIKRYCDLLLAIHSLTLTIIEQDESKAHYEHRQDQFLKSYRKLEYVLKQKCHYFDLETNLYSYLDYIKVSEKAYTAFLNYMKDTCPRRSPWQKEDIWFKLITRKSNKKAPSKKTSPSKTTISQTQKALMKSVEGKTQALNLTPEFAHFLKRSEQTLFSSILHLLEKQDHTSSLKIVATQKLFKEKL